MNRREDIGGGNHASPNRRYWPPNSHIALKRESAIITSQRRQRHYMPLWDLRIGVFGGELPAPAAVVVGAEVNGVVRLSVFRGDSSVTNVFRIPPAKAESNQPPL